MGHYAASTSTHLRSTSNPYTRDSEHKAREGVGDNISASTSLPVTEETVTKARASSASVHVDSQPSEGIDSSIPFVGS